MDFLNAILTPEVLHGIIIVAALSFMMRSILVYNRETSRLQPRLDKIDRDLARLLEGLPERKDRVKKLTETVAPLLARSSEMTALVAAYTQIEQDHQQEVNKQHEQRTKSSRRIERGTKNY